MVKSCKTHSLHDVYCAYDSNPRVKYLEIHRKWSPYKTRDATTKFIKSAFKKQIIVGPFLYVNSGFSVELSKKNVNPLKELKALEFCPKVTHAIALSGDHTLLVISRCGNDLNYTECIKPSCPSPSCLQITNIDFDEQGKLGTDLYPYTWNETDWKVFHAMRDPTRSFFSIGKRIGINWMTVKRHYEKILADCKILTAFFPLGYNGYDRIFMTFKTKYEIGLKNAISKLDRSSYLWKFRDTIILILFVDDYNDTSERFYELEENGLIHGLHVSIPIRYHVPDFNPDRAVQGLPRRRKE